MSAADDPGGGGVSTVDNLGGGGVSAWEALCALTR